MEGTAVVVAEIAAAITIPISVAGVVAHRIYKGLGMGYRSLQFLAIGVVTPSILILALEDKLSGEAVAAMLGGILAYLFANSAKGSD